MAFAPALPTVSPMMTRTTAPVMGMESELGATGPLGFWDPLGLVRSREPC